MEHDQFGSSMSVDNGIIAVGKPTALGNGIDIGSAYLFDASTGAQLFILLQDDGVVFDKFGTSIAIDSGVVAVGALGEIGRASCRERV